MYEVVASTTRYAGRIITVRTDSVVMPDGSVAERDVVRHPGAVGALALDADGQALLIRQYRHALGTYLWELPAGLRDVAGEPPLTTAQRELAEETGWAARTWEHLVDVHPTPGWTDEAYTVFVARDLSLLAERPALHGEELDLTLRWLPLGEACTWVLDGRITNGLCATAVLAAARRLGL